MGEDKLISKDTKDADSWSGGAVGVVTDDLLDYTIEEVTQSPEFALQNKLKNRNYATVYLVLAKLFSNVRCITINQLNRTYLDKKHLTDILDFFVLVGLLLRHKVSRNIPATYRPLSLEDFLFYLPLAKETLGMNKQKLVNNVTESK